MVVDRDHIPPCLLQIKDTFLRTYTDAMQNYNGNDERSRAVDHVQRSVSSREGDWAGHCL